MKWIIKVIGQWNKWISIHYCCSYNNNNQFYVVFPEIITIRFWQYEILLIIFTGIYDILCRKAINNTIQILPTDIILSAFFRMYIIVLLLLILLKLLPSIHVSVCLWVWMCPHLHIIVCHYGNKNYHLLTN